MKINTYEFPTSSFLSLEKDAAIIVQRLLHNDRFKKLLYYTDKHCLKNVKDFPNLTDEQTISLINRNILVDTKIDIESEIANRVLLTFDNFTPNDENPEFRDNYIYFDIICHDSQVNLGDFQWRPYKIAGEIDSMLNKQRLTGIGKLEFAGANKMRWSNDFSGLTLLYRAIHGKEDKK